MWTRWRWKDKEREKGMFRIDESFSRVIALQSPSCTSLCPRKWPQYENVWTILLEREPNLHQPTKNCKDMSWTSNIEGWLYKSHQNCSLHGKRERESPTQGFSFTWHVHKSHYKMSVRLKEPCWSTWSSKNLGYYKMIFVDSPVMSFKRQEISWVNNQDVAASPT